MRCVVQRVKRGAVTIAGSGRREVGRGLFVLVGIHVNDTERDATYMADKIAGLRIFPDAEGKMNLSISDLECGECLIVSQFTLYGDARRGKRPSFVDAAQPLIAIPLYERFARLLRASGLKIETGEFGTDMLVEIENDGPVTILIDSTKTF